MASRGASLFVFAGSQTPSVNVNPSLTRQAMSAEPLGASAQSSEVASLGGQAVQELGAALQQL